MDSTQYGLCTICGGPLTAGHDCIPITQPAPAPMPEQLDSLVGRIFNTQRIPGEVPVPDWYINLHNDATELAEEVMRQFPDLTRRLAEAEAGLEFYHGLAKELHDHEVACIARAESAEARVRELEETLAGQADVYAKLGAVTERYKERMVSAEAFKSRVMAWARGRCEYCGWMGSPEGHCPRCKHLGLKFVAADQDNWAPPKAWEVGE